MTLVVQRAVCYAALTVKMSRLMVIKSTSLVATAGELARQLASAQINLVALASGASECDKSAA